MATPTFFQRVFQRFFERQKLDPDAQRRLDDAEKEAAAERRREAAESRRESERRWYAHLPIMAIATLCTAVAILTGLLVAASQYTSPPPKEQPPLQAPVPQKPATPDPPASAPKQVSMSFKNSELFGYNSSILRALTGVAQRELDRCADPSTTRAHIIGHADCIGSDEYNQDLSERRAVAVKRYLIDRGLNAALISTEGQGARRAKAEPLCTGVVRATSANVAKLEQFRRVDVTCDHARQLAHGFMTWCSVLGA
jgi:outer membrane protein OmpA-like peptidoglycan-associated protein